jgi:DNA helicase II / ATP-dependent DNA helicase PcrA
MLSLQNASLNTTNDWRLINRDNYREQDTNPLQARIYRALAAAEPHNLCVVGDDDQALFRFRGGTVDCLVHFVQECRQAWPGCEVAQLALVENYRSQPTIVEWCNHFIAIHPQMSLPHARITGKEPLRAQLPTHAIDPAIWAIRGKNPKECAANFVMALRMLKEEGILESYAHCALLAHSFKRKTPGYAYVSELKKQGIPAVGLSSHKEQQVYKQILGTLFLLLDSSNNLLPDHFTATNARYVEECRNVAGTEPILNQMARQVNRWLLTDQKGAANMSLTRLAQRILNAAPVIATIEQDPDAEAAAHMLIQTLDAYDRVV